MVSRDHLIVDDFPRVDLRGGVAGPCVTIRARSLEKASHIRHKGSPGSAARPFSSSSSSARDPARFKSGLLRLYPYVVHYNPCSVSTVRSTYSIVGLWSSPGPWFSCSEILIDPGPGIGFLLALAHVRSC